MKEIVLRPLALFCFSFYILTCTVKYAAASEKLIIASAFAAAFILLILLKLTSAVRNSKAVLAYIRALSAVFLGITAAACLSYYAFDIYLADIEEPDGETCEIEAVVEEVRYTTAFSGEYIIKTRSIGGTERALRIILGDDPGLVEGNVIRTTAHIGALSSQGDSARSSLLADGVRLSADGEDTEIISFGASSPKIFFSSVNRRLCNILADPRAGEDSGIAAALFLGNRERLSPEVSKDFKRLGISHILALSGMHLAIVCGAVSSLTKRFGAVMCRIICAAAIVLYVILTGASPSVCRAGIMLLIMYAGGFAGKRGDSFTNLGAAVFLLSATDPLGAGGISLQLSAAAVFAILLQTERVQKIETFLAAKEVGRARTLLSKISVAMWITVSVVLFTLPLTWLYFGYFSAVAPVTSIIFSALATLILYLTPIALLLAPTAHLSGAAFYVLGTLCSATSKLAAEISAMRGIVIPLSGTVMLILCVVCFIAFIVCSALHGKGRKCAAVITVLLFVFTCMVGALSAGKPGKVSIAAVNAKSSDEIVIVSRGKATVIDVGNGYAAAITSGIDAAEDMGCTEIETLMLTHSHNAYPSSLANIMRRCTVRRLAVPDTFDDKMLERLYDICDMYGTELELYTPEELLLFGEATVRTYTPLYLSRSVQPIVRVDVSAFGDCVTYLGASYFEAVDSAKIDSESTVLLGCHGPKYKDGYQLLPYHSGRIIDLNEDSDRRYETVILEK